MAHHPWLTILAWVVAAVAVIATSPGLPTTTNESSFLPKSYESIRAANLQDKALPQAGHVTAFASLILAGNTILAQLGFAAACGIALAAFVMAMFFSPSLTALIGRRAWWPGHAANRRHPPDN